MFYIYLHGFASSPESAKARDLLDRFHAFGLDLKVPDFNQSGFTQLTLTRQIQQVEGLLPLQNTAEQPPVTLIGSSLGGLTAAWVAERNPQVVKLLLLAPAFDFLAHWVPRLGQDQLDHWRQDGLLPVFHYREQQMLPLHYGFLTDAEQYRDDQLRRPVDTLILHGRHDEIIPFQSSQTYAAARPWVQLVELDSDHALGNVHGEIWEAITAFCLR
jgi:pimeloyl-ACP methyl ester carboxylesterase